MYVCTPDVKRLYSLFIRSLTSHQFTLRPNKGSPGDYDAAEKRRTGPPRDRAAGRLGEKSCRTDWKRPTGL